MAYRDDPAAPMAASVKDTTATPNFTINVRLQARYAGISAGERSEMHQLGSGRLLTRRFAEPATDAASPLGARPAARSVTASSGPAEPTGPAPSARTRPQPVLVGQASGISIRRNLPMTARTSPAGTGRLKK
jgi:hypothetical protein